MKTKEGAREKRRSFFYGVRYKDGVRCLNGTELIKCYILLMDISCQEKEKNVCDMVE